jgi:uncharacterized protein (TIGR00297 family)
VPPIVEIFAPYLNLLHPDSVSERIMPGLAVTIAFGLLAYLLRGVTRDGALAGTLSAFVIYVGLGPGGFVTLLAVFVLTWLCTRAGSQKKHQLGLAQDHRGRDAGQVLANVAAAALFAAVASRHVGFGVAFVAAMAEAAADTSQSEIGEIASGRAWLITSFREVAPGTNGGVTFIGLLAGAIAAAVVALVARLTHVIDPGLAGIAGVGGFLGSIVDSLLGATIERRGWLNNNAVNFLSTMASGAIAIALFRIGVQS